MAYTIFKGYIRTLTYIGHKASHWLRRIENKEKGFSDIYDIYGNTQTHL